MANGKRSAFSAKPSQLAQPIPGQNADAEADAFLGSLDLETPEPQAPSQIAQVAPEPQAIPVDPAAAEAESFLGSLDAPDEIEADPVQTAKESFDQQIGESFTRLRNAFAVTGKERQSVLEGFFGAGNVKLQNGTAFVRRKPGGKFQRFDRDELELIGDTIDFSRDIFEGVIENTFRVGGAIGGAGVGAVAGAGKGAAVGAPAGPPGAALGGAAGAISEGALGGIAGAGVAGGVGAGVALNAGDFVAQNLLDIPRDESRDRVDESALAGAFGAGFGAGGFLGSRLVRKRAAKKALAKQTEELEKFTPTNVKGTVEDGIEAVERLKQSGLISGDIAGRKVLVTPRQLDPTNPQLVELEDEIFRSDAGFRNFLSEQNKKITDAYVAVAGGARRISGDTGTFAKKLFDARTVEGETIGKFREQALKASRGERKQLPGFREEVTKQLSEFADPKARGRLKLLSAEDILDESPDLTREQAEFLRKRLLKFSEMSEKGASLKTVDTEYTVLRGKIDQMIGSSAGRALARRLIPLKNSLERDRTELIGQELSGETAKAYGKAKDRFSSVMNSLEQLNSSLLNEDISQRALIRGIFSQGNKGLPTARAIRNLTQTTHPDLWKNLTNEYFHEVLRSQTDSATKLVNWKQVKKTFDNLGPEFKKELTTGGQFNTKELDAVLKLGVLSQQSPRTFRTSTQNISVAEQGLKAMTSRYAQASALARVIKTMGGEKNALVKYLSEDGLDQVTKKMKPAQAAQVRSRFQTALDSLGDKVTGGIGAAATGARKLAPTVIRRELAGPDEEAQPELTP